MKSLGKAAAIWLVGTAVTWLIPVGVAAIVSGDTGHLWSEFSGLVLTFSAIAWAAIVNFYREEKK